MENNQHYDELNEFLKEFADEIGDVDEEYTEPYYEAQEEEEDQDDYDIASVIDGIRTRYRKAFTSVLKHQLITDRINMHDAKTLVSYISAYSMVTAYREIAKQLRFDLSDIDQEVTDNLTKSMDTSVSQRVILEVEIEDIRDEMNDWEDKLKNMSFLERILDPWYKEKQEAYQQLKGKYAALVALQEKYIRMEAVIGHD